METELAGSLVWKLYRWNGIPIDHAVYVLIH